MVLLGRLLGHGISFTGLLAGIAVILMMTQITIDVAGKYLFNIPVPATIAIVSNYYMVAVAFLPLALAERRNDHIGVELVTEMMPHRAQWHLYSWTNLFSAILLAFFAYAGWLEATTKHNIGAFIIERSHRIPVWPSYYLLPIGAALMSLTLFYRFVRYLTGARSGLNEVMAVDEPGTPPEAPK